MKLCNLLYSSCGTHWSPLMAYCLFSHLQPSRTSRTLCSCSMATTLIWNSITRHSWLAKGNIADDTICREDVNCSGPSFQFLNQFVKRPLLASKVPMTFQILQLCLVSRLLMSWTYYLIMSKIPGPNQWEQPRFSLGLMFGAPGCIEKVSSARWITSMPWRP